jgi:hypothetical protein
LIYVLKHWKNATGSAGEKFMFILQNKHLPILW